MTREYWVRAAAWQKTEELLQHAHLCNSGRLHFIELSTADYEFPDEQDLVPAVTCERCHQTCVTTRIPDPRALHSYQEVDDATAALFAALRHHYGSATDRDSSADWPDAATARMIAEEPW